MSSSLRLMCLSLAICACLAGCSQNATWNPSSWFTASIEQKPQAQQTPGFGKDPLVPPTPAPVPPVQRVIAPVVQPVAARPVGATKSKVALLLPLSGSNAALGQSMLNAAQQAVFDAASDNFELIPRDTGSDEVGAASAARDAVANGAQLIIGPVFASNVPAVQQATQNTGINILTLSSDVSVAAPGVFVMGFAPAAEVDRLVAYATRHGGLHHFGALVPNTNYGALVGQAFQDAVVRHGGLVEGYEVFNPAANDVATHIQNLAIKHNQIDALFLPEGGADLAQIAAQVAQVGFDSRLVRFLGTGLWDEPALGQKNPGLVTGWYAASDPSARLRFINAYKSTYGQEPPRLATLAYDATALAAVLAKHGGSFSVVDLTNPSGFMGVDGIFRLNNQGITERGLAINEVTAGGIRVIDPAPASF